MEQEEIYCWLQNKIAVPSTALFGLLNTFDDINGLFSVNPKELYSIFPGADFGLMNRILESLNPESVYENTEGLKKSGVRYVSFLSNDYPEKLREIDNPPFGIFYKGSLPAKNRKSVAIIGSRRCSEYGKETAYFLGRELAEAGCAVISGMALGVDGYAQRGAILKGETYAVLAGGPDLCCYPRENIDIYRRLTEGKGGILSEKPLLTPALPRYFVERNRIISGLSDAVIVVEAAEKSGTAITVNFALMQNREVFAVPGRINDRMSTGCNELIQSGAQILLSPEDVLQYLGLFVSGKTREKPKAVLDKREKIIFSYIENGRADMETLLVKSGFPVGELNEILVRLEIKGIIKKTDMAGYSPV